MVEEAATEVIAREHAAGRDEPWRSPAFIDTIVEWQRERQLSAPAEGLLFFDRSPVCTYALSLWLGYPPSAALLAELERIRAGQVFERRVFFAQNLGFCTPTQARRISYEESLRFEQVHAEAYRRWDYELVMVPAAPVTKRADLVLGAVGRGP